LDSKKWIRFALAGAALALLSSVAVACGDDDDDDDDDSPTATSAAALSPTIASSSDSAQIAVADIVFSPGALTISPGTTVTWSWSGDLPHSVVGEFDGENVASDTMTGSGSFEFTFESAGTFNYQCGVHGASMSGTITVEG
jgi:plastocyanin